MTRKLLLKSNLPLPLQIEEASLDLWYDFSRPLGFAPQPADGASIALVKDLSGNGTNANQPTALKQPTFRTSTTSAPSGLPIVRTNGTSQGMFSDTFSLGPNFTVLIAGKFASADLNSLFIEFGPDANLNDGFYLYGGDMAPNLRVRTSGVTYDLLISPNYPGANFVIIAARSAQSAAAGGPLEILKNGVSLGTQAATMVANSSLWPLNMGVRDNGSGPLFTAGDWGELLLYGNYLSNAALVGLTDYLNHKWLG